MSRNFLILIACAGFALWYFRDTAPVSQAIQSAATASRTAQQQLSPEQTTTTNKQLQQHEPASGLKKCAKGQQILYTSDPCPAGYKLKDIEGNVTVLPTTSPSDNNQTSSKLPNARDLLGVNEPLKKNKAN